MKVLEEYRSELAKVLSAEPDSLFLFWKGRVALYAILEAMDVGPGDEVILPAFTCVVVPNAIIYRGATPVYVDISQDTLNAGLEGLSSAISEKTKVIICQNTLGLSTDVEKIAELAKEKGLMTIEDCTHGFGGSYKGRPNGSYCDAAFYSTQWNKPHSTGIGGFGWVRDEGLVAKMHDIVSSYAQPSLKDEFSLVLLLFVRKYLLKNWNYWPAVKLFRWLSKKNLVLGSSSGEEITGIKEPAGYKTVAGKVQAKEGLRSLIALPEILERRKNNAHLLTELLSKLGKYHVPAELHKDHAFLKYPILVKDRKQFEDIAVSEKIQLGDWFNSFLHPVQEDFGKWGLNEKDFPVAGDVSGAILNIPCDTIAIDRYLVFLAKYMDELR